jgi:hypothetical protein
VCVCVCVRNAQRGRGCVCMSVCGSVRTPAESVRPERDWPARRLPRDAAWPLLRAGQAVVPHRDHPASDERVLAGPARTPTHRHAPLTVPPSGLSNGCVGVDSETCAGRGGTGGTFSAPLNILRAADVACEREQRSASDGTPVTGACLDTVPRGTVVCAHCPHRSVNKRQMSAETRAHRVVDEREGSLFHVPLPLRRAGAWLLWSCNSESNNAKA